MPTRADIPTTFARLREKRQFALLPFIPAGYPDLATTQALLPALADSGAAMIEIGFPFSDPVADGPTIQAAFNVALSKGLRVADIFVAVDQVREKVSCPLVAMVSFSVVFRYGVDKFLKDARAAGFDGLIIPDLPPPEAQLLCGKIKAAGLAVTLLVAPTTSPKRREEIGRLCDGFVYYLSVSGITGQRDALPEDLQAQLRQLRTVTDRPICVGFGISKPQHMAQLAPLADGAIVGSAIVKQITQMIEQNPATPPAQIAQSIAAYCQSLLNYAPKL